VGKQQVSRLISTRTTGGCPIATAAAVAVNYLGGRRHVATARSRNMLESLLLLAKRLLSHALQDPGGQFVGHLSAVDNHHIIGDQ